MFRRLLLAPTIVLLVSLQLLSPPTGAAAGRTVNATFTSPNFGYALSYDDPWSVVEDGSVRGEELLVLTDGVANVLVAATDIFGDDAEACVPATAEQFTSDPAISDVQAAVDADGAEISGADEFGAYGLYQYLFDSPDAPVSEYTLAVQCFHLTPDALLIVLFDVQTAAFEDELPLFLTLLEGLTLPTTEAAEPRAEPPASALWVQAPARQSACNSVSRLLEPFRLRATEVVLMPRSCWIWWPHS